MLKTDNYGIRRQKTKQGFPLCGVETHARLWPAPGVSRSIPQPARTAKKRCFSHKTRHRRHDSPPHRTRVTTKFGERYAAVRMRVLAAEFEGRRLSVSGGLSLGRGGLTQFCINILRYRTGHFRREKKIQKWVRLPRLKRDASRHKTIYSRSNLAARALSLVEHTLFKFGGESCPVRRGLVAAVKARFFLYIILCKAENRNDPSLPTAQLTGFSTMKGNPVLFCFLATLLSS